MLRSWPLCSFSVKGEGFLGHVATAWMRVRAVKHESGSSCIAREEENAEQQTNKQNPQWLRHWSQCRV